MVLYMCYGGAQSDENTVPQNAMKIFEKLVLTVFVFELVLHTLGVYSQKQHVFWKQAADNFMIYFIADFCHFVS